jgi:DNA-binding response OmpR family regulator
MAMELGASEFLTKPFSPKKLYARAAELAGIAPEEPAAGEA